MSLTGDLGGTRFEDPETGAKYTLIARGTKVFAHWDATPDRETEVSHAYLNQEWVKVEGIWIIYKPLHDTFRLFDSLDALAEYFLPWWNDVFKSSNPAQRKSWSHLGVVTGKGDLGNRTYRLTVRCAMQLRKNEDGLSLTVSNMRMVNGNLGSKRPETS